MVEFNIFRNLGLTENQHSNFLKKMLSPRGSHNQGCLFLEEFLKTIGINYDCLTSNSINVYTEKQAGKRGRIDLSLTIGDSTIIIENKINGAKDQSGQLYRYWKNAIYNEKKFIAFCKVHNIPPSNNLALHQEFCKQESKQHKLIYLAKSRKTNSITPNSILKPNVPTYERQTLLPSELPFPIIELGYKEDIIPWLENCLPKITDSASCSKHILKSIIEQYIAFIKSI